MGCEGMLCPCTSCPSMRDASPLAVLQVAIQSSAGLPEAAPRSSSSSKEMDPAFLILEVNQRLETSPRAYFHTGKRGQSA